jgi:hypothetical protein
MNPGDSRQVEKAWVENPANPWSAFGLPTSFRISDLIHAGGRFRRMMNRNIKGDGEPDRRLRRIDRPPVQQRNGPQAFAFLSMEPCKALFGFRMTRQVKDLNVPLPNHIALELLIHIDRFMVDGLALMQLPDDRLQN